MKVDLHARLFAKDFQMQIQVKQNAFKKRKRTSKCLVEKVPQREPYARNLIKCNANKPFRLNTVSATSVKTVLSARRKEPSYTSEGLLTRIASGLRHAKLREASFPQTQQETQVQQDMSENNIAPFSTSWMIESGVKTT